VELTPEERGKIYLEEKAGLEIRRELEASKSLPGRPTSVLVKTRPTDGNGGRSEPLHSWCWTDVYRPGRARTSLAGSHGTGIPKHNVISNCA